MKLRLKLLLAAALALFGRGAAQPPQSPDEHRSLAIYQIMVASFRHSDGGAPGYSAMWGPDGHTKNGNIKGITEALDHIASLGVNAIWLTPVFDSSRAAGGEKLQATGYFTNDYFAIDPHFGTEEEFRQMVDEAHRRGLYVILDGVFGHHGGVDKPSPKGHVLDCTVTGNDRNEGTGNIKYPRSLPYIQEVATYWIEKYGIDGWRLDQAYQAIQGGHNYWTEIRAAVEAAAARRRARGERWGTLGYMVGEDWGDAGVINRGVFRDNGLLSAFDFQGKELISGPMQSTEPGLANGWDDVETILSPSTARGYSHDNFLPNLFLSNHDGYRAADHFESTDSLRYSKLKTLNAILACYSGPVTLYYGDEYADTSLHTTGGQKDNIGRTSGHLDARNANEQSLCDYIAHAFDFRRDNPAMWRGTASFERLNIDGADVLKVEKYDSDSGNRILVIFSDHDTTVDPGYGLPSVRTDAYVPEFIVLTPPQQLE